MSVNFINMKESEFNELKAIVQRIETAILGDEGAGVEGLAKKVNRHDKSINNLQRVAWTAVGIGCSIGTVLAIYKIFVG